jgi:hypothetical protein
MWKLAVLVPVVAALVVGAAAAVARDEPARSDPGRSPGLLMTRLVEDMSDGLYERAWLSLHPAHRRVAPQAEYASCERLLPFADVESVRVLAVRRETVAVPGLRRSARGAAISLRIELWAPAGAAPVVVTPITHAVRTAEGWRWVLPAPRFEDYRADRCPADPAA